MTAEIVLVRERARIHTHQQVTYHFKCKQLQGICSAVSQVKVIKALCLHCLMRSPNFFIAIH